MTGQARTQTDAETLARVQARWEAIGGMRPFDLTVEEALAWEEQSRRTEAEVLAMFRRSRV